MLSDKIAVLYNGSLSQSFDAEKLNPFKIGLMMAGKDLMIDFRLEQRDFVSPWLAFFAPICAVLFSLLVASILILLAGVSPLKLILQAICGSFWL